MEKVVHEYAIESYPDPLGDPGDRLYRSHCACGWRSRGWLDVEAAHGEGLNHGAVRRIPTNQQGR